MLWQTTRSSWGKLWGQQTWQSWCTLAQSWRMCQCSYWHQQKMLWHSSWWSFCPFVVEAVPTAGQGTPQAHAFYERGHDRMYFCDLQHLLRFAFTYDEAVPLKPSIHVFITLDSAVPSLIQLMCRQSRLVATMYMWTWLSCNAECDYETELSMAKCMHCAEFTASAQLTTKTINTSIQQACTL